ncbi:MAG: FtsX-like permease family protein, partial [Acidobacteriota bacterium]
GLVVFLQLSRTEIQRSLTHGGRVQTSGFAGKRLRHAIVVAEIAVALVLLIGTGLLLRSFSQLLAVDPGFDAADGAVIETHVWSRYATEEERALFFANSLAAIVALPGVESAGAVSSLPFLPTRIDKNNAFGIVGRPAPTPADQPVGFHSVVTPGYFEAMGIPLRRGRLFTKLDAAEGAYVALINETMRDRYWPEVDPIGASIVVRSMGPARLHEIVGVVGDVRHAGLDRSPRAELFVPHRQNPTGSMTYFIRPSDPETPILESVRRAMWSVDKDLAISTATTLRDLMAESVAERRLSLYLFSAFAAIALALAAIGVYSLIRFTTMQTAREIGLRMAIGATGWDIVRLVLGKKLLLIACGLVLGGVGAYVLSRFMASLLYGVTPTDGRTFTAMALLLAVVALVASYIPVRRIIDGEPMRVLRDE